MKQVLLLGLIILVSCSQIVAANGQNMLNLATKIQVEWGKDKSEAISDAFEYGNVIQQRAYDGRVIEYSRSAKKVKRHIVTFGSLQRRERLYPDNRGARSGELLLRLTKESVENDEFKITKVRHRVRTGLPELDKALWRWQVTQMKQVARVKRNKTPTDNLFRWYRIRFPMRYNLNLVIKDLKKEPDIELVGPNYTYAIGSTIPDK